MMVDYLLSDWNNITDDDYKIDAAMFIEYYGTDETKKNIDETKKKQIEESWKKYKLKGVPLGEWINKSSIRIRDDYKPDFDNLKENLIYDIISDYEIQFLGHVLVKNGYNMYFNSYISSYINSNYFTSDVEVEFKKESDDAVKERVDWVFWLKNYKAKNCRSFMPCFEYENLWVKNESIPENDYDPMNLFEKISYPKTVCPYIIRGDKFVWDCSDELIQWVYENRCDEDVKIDNIEEAFKEMKEGFFSKYVNADGEIIDQSKGAQKQEEKVVEPEAAPKSEAQEEKKAEPETATESQEQEEREAEPKATPKSKNRKKRKTASKAATKSQKQEEKKTKSKNAPKLSKSVSKKTRVKAPKAKPKKS